MDILSLIDKFIQWCDGNVGFLNVILSLCTLILHGRRIDCTELY